MSDDLLARFQSVEEDVARIKAESIRAEAEIAQHRKRLEELKEQARKLGVDPDKINEIITQKREQITILVEGLEKKTADFAKRKSLS